MRSTANRACAAAPLLALLATWGAAAQSDPPVSLVDTDHDGVIDVRELVGDSDGDTIPDVQDPDDDGDGVLTLYEYVDPLGTLDDELTPVTIVFLDTDADGKPDYVDSDDDNDGLATLLESPDPNHDGNPSDARVTAAQEDSSIRVPDYRRPDDDSDGIPTKRERWDNQDHDSDGDGKPDHLDDDDDNDGVLQEDESDADGDGLPNYRDPDDDNDGVPSLVEGATPRDTDSDGVLDMLDPEDDGDGALTRDELGPGGGAAPRDTDGDGKPDYIDVDDDDDGLASKDERPRGDTDGDAIADPLDADDDGDAISTLFERAFVSDVDGDGIVNWYDLDSDGDGVSDLDEGTGDDDGDGVPNFVDPTDNRVAPPESSGGGGSSSGGGSSNSGGTGGLETEPSSDGGCQAAGSAQGGQLIAWLLLALAVSARRARAGVLAVALCAASACGDQDDDTVDLSDAGFPSIDAGQTPQSDAGPIMLVDAGPSLGSACTVEGDVLAQLIEEPRERAFSAALANDTLHLAYVARTCGVVGTASGTRIEHLSFRSTGALGAPEIIADDRAGVCSLRKSPAIAVNANGVLDVYFTSSEPGSYELYRRELSSGATPQRVTIDAPSTPRDELSTVATSFGDAPLLAYVVESAVSVPSQLVTMRQGRAPLELVAISEGQRPDRLALAPLSAGGGVVGWISEQASGSTVRVRAVDIAGAPRAAAVELSTQVGSLSSIGLASNGSSAAAVYVAQSANIGELRHRSLGTDGQVAATESSLTGANRVVTGAAIAAYAKGFVVAFREVSQMADTGSALQLMFITAEGQVVGERRVADASNGGGASQVFVFPDGRLAVTWVDYGAAGATLRAVRVRCF